MFDVYLNEKRDRLLVVPKGQPIPNIGNSGRWRKKKGAVAVSDEIKLALQRDGFYWRRRAEHRGSDSLPSKPTSPVAAKATCSWELSSGGAIRGERSFADYAPERAPAVIDPETPNNRAAKSQVVQSVTPSRAFR